MVLGNDQTTLNPLLYARLYSWPQRLNAVFTSVITVLGACAVLFALSSSIYFNRASSRAPHTAIENVGVLALHEDLAGDVAFMDVSISYDLRSLWHWNVHTLFVYLVATYESPRHRSELTLWDTVISDVEAAHRPLAQLPLEYNLVDKGRGLAGTEVQLQLRWSVLPYTGLLLSERGTAVNVTLPTEYAEARPRIQRQRPTWVHQNG
eukprot:TRINITY_DN692_c0_g3_i2.p1 TRINITY_DN692_c0_g3~~TRINITY_DN692_c0_g3_i2.p1  ORF type:complete len:207 (-),score=10.52 TRINITY_DN692_c0_g3_i2:184-804(-)